MFQQQPSCYSPLHTASVKQGFSSFDGAPVAQLSSSEAAEEELLQADVRVGDVYALLVGKHTALPCAVYSYFETAQWHTNDILCRHANTGSFTFVHKRVFARFACKDLKCKDCTFFCITAR